MISEHRFATPAAMAEALAADIASALSESIAAAGRASLIVSGGRTPQTMFDDLSHRELAWNRVTLSLADERLVPATDPDSNERLVRDHLLQNEAQHAVFVPLWQGEGDPVEGAAEALRNIARPFAMVILGLGEDGHFASLFPGIPNLARALDPTADLPAIFVPALWRPQAAHLAHRRLAPRFSPHRPGLYRRGQAAHLRCRARTRCR
jgi:6-phosphogluconolactonase